MTWGCHRGTAASTRGDAVSDEFEELGEVGDRLPGCRVPRKIEQLRQLGELKNQGVLTEAEFEEQKRVILG
ncbi:SHOCT domain-containing protein [Streptomyces sp. D2-8]|nr:SHOCT domain-containing protein [Streptomyces sp. D2-8]